MPIDVLHMKARLLGWTGLRKFGAALPFALAAGALLLVFLGPSLDHHFAERQFGHGHVYLNSGAPGHVHFYEDPHGHSHGSVADGHLHLLPEDGAGARGSNEIVYLTSNDGTGTAFAGLSGPLADQEFGFKEPGNDSMLGIFSDEAVHVGAFVPPPKRPPRI
jgi:hypothetical protein